jgi:transposase InsO family protein
MKVIQCAARRARLPCRACKEGSENSQKGPRDGLSRGHQEAKLIQRRHKAYPVGRFWSATRRTGRFHRNMIAAIDLCVVPTLTFERLFAFLVLSHGRRKLLRFEVTRHPTAEWLVRQITEAFPWNSAPAYLVRDNDHAYGHVFTSRVRAMGIRDRPISPGSPWQNGITERFIGTLRRECLDQVVIFSEMHLRRILSAYAAYYNQVRTHLALQKDAPLHRGVQRSGAVLAIPILAGLHHQYVRI